VATLEQKVDHPHFGISQINSTLHTTTTIVCQILIESTPPKISTKFENSLLVAISSNTWQASN
jgi:hypothetical protein